MRERGKGGGRRCLIGASRENPAPPQKKRSSFSSFPYYFLLLSFPPAGIFFLPPPFYTFLRGNRVCVRRKEKRSGDDYQSLRRGGGQARFPREESRPGQANVFCCRDISRVSDRPTGRRSEGELRKRNSRLMSGFWGDGVSP